MLLSVQTECATSAVRVRAIRRRRRRAAAALRRTRHRRRRVIRFRPGLVHGKRTSTE